MKKLFILAAFIGSLFVSAPSRATTRTAATCNAVDVQAQVNLSVNGDTVIVPAGNCTWNVASGGITIPAGIGITIQGNGTPQSAASLFGASSSCATGTNITMVGGSTSPYLTAFKGSPNFASSPSTLRLSCMNIVYGSGGAIAFSIAGACTIGGCPNIRVDNITFTNWAAHTSGGATNGISFGISVVNDVFGVLDHNTIVGATPNFLQLVEISHANVKGAVNGAWGDQSWAQAEGYGSQNFLFIENNHFSTAGCCENEGAVANGQQGGGFVVVRFNLFDNMDNNNFSMGWHGTESNGRARGMRAFEYYGNNWSCTFNTHCGSMAGGRSGTGLYWGNTSALPPGTGSINSYFTNSTFRASGSPSSAWPSCDGSRGWDTNDTNGGGANTAFIYYSDTIANVSGGVITVTGTPGWSANQWVGSNGSLFSVHDITKNNGSQITASGSNTLTYNVQGGPSPLVPAIGDSIQILRAFVCLDPAAGRGQGVLYDSTQNPALQVQASEALSPEYAWLNTFAKLPTFGTSQITNNGIDLNTIALRDWYAENLNQPSQSSAAVPFDGTATTTCVGGLANTVCGIGHGTLANRPATCTTNTWYWDINGGSWNSSGNSTGQGQGYKCTSTNTWTLFYTPFSYPHPLTVSGPSPNVNFSPASISFGSFIVGTTSGPQTITITNVGTANMTWATYSTSQPGSTTFADNHTGTCPVANAVGLAPGASCTVILTGETNNVGVQNGSFNFPSNAPGSPQTVPLSITGVTGPITASPNPVNFGGQTVGTTSAGVIVTVTNGSGVTLTMTGNSLVTGTNFAFIGGSTCTGTLTNGNTCTVTVNFSPQPPITSPTILSDTLQIAFTGAAGSPLSVPLSGTGLPSTVTAPATSLFAINLAGCPPATPPTTVFCMTQDGGMYVSVCGDASCAAYSPAGVSSLSVNGSPAHKGNVRVTVNAGSSTGSN